MRPHPVTPWSAASDGSPGLALRQCLEAAAAAPSIYNSQPWRFRLRQDGVDVLADHSRRLNVVDPRGRELLISVGAAVLNLRIAMLAHGRMPVLRLFPSPAEPDLVAQITIGAHVRVTETVEALARAIPRRHTNRRPFAEIAVPPGVMSDLVVAAKAEGGELTVADDAGQQAILSVIRTADAHWRAQPSYWAEIAEWTEAGNDRCDGVTPEAFGPWSAGETMPLRDFGLVQPTRRRQIVGFERMPTIVVVSTRADTPEAWVRAGLALERVLLTATVRGLASTPMTQALELEELRRVLVNPAGGKVPQAVLRLGYGPPCPPSRRRPLSQMLVPAPLPPAPATAPGRPYRPVRPGRAGSGHPAATGVPAR